MAVASPAPSFTPPLPPDARQRLAVVGGGWAGWAAAIALTQRGHEVTLYEAARQWGGRARSLKLKGPQGQHWTVDNGQHILIGAYTQCLQLMRTVGIAPEAVLHRRPLDLRYASGQGLRLPDLPAPWNAVLGILRARGWSLSDRWHLLCRAAQWQRRQFRCGAHETVADLCEGLPPALLRDFIDPLCLSALNLPAHEASGPIFLRILQDSLFAGRGGSDLLIPTQDLGALLPQPAAQWLHAQGGAAHSGHRVRQIAPQLATDGTLQGWRVDQQAFDGVVLATTSAEAARLTLGAAAQAPLLQESLESWAACSDSLPHTAITTVYAFAPQARLPTPMVALRGGLQAPAQFAFDRGQLGGPEGLIALVISTSHGSRDMLQTQALEQARQQLALPQLEAVKTVVEKRATFACTPEAARPPARIVARLWACGDYIEGPYPATLEGAVLSGLELAHAFDPGHLA